MKRFILFLFVAFLSFNFCASQEWMTSLDVAKRLALVQNKMLFVVWEEALLYPYPIQVKREDGKLEILDLSEIDDALDTVIWDYFVPVILSEKEYDKLYSKIDGKRNLRYIEKFNDDSIKIMDVNFNILNVESYDIINSGKIPLQNRDFIKFIEIYSLNTKYLNGELIVYNNTPSFITAYNLGSKYLDFSMYSKLNLRKELINLANIYLDESKAFLEISDLKNKSALNQKFELLKLKESLILGNAKKVLRQLRRIDEIEVAEINEKLYAFLHFTAYRMIGDENNATPWRTKVSLVDLKKSSFIVNSNL